jgi:hypothetical protein
MNAENIMIGSADAEALINALAYGGVHSAAPVDQVPDVSLRQWAVYEATDNEGKISRHFVGFDAYQCEGRASTSIVNFDKQTMMGTTSSGREYLLRGNPGYNDDAHYVWSIFKRRNGLGNDVNVSDEYRLD